MYIYKGEWLINWLIDWLINWLIDWYFSTNFFASLYFAEQLSISLHPVLQKTLTSLSLDWKKYDEQGKYSRISYVRESQSASSFALARCGGKR